ncbi:MAG TPA: peptide chain release factor N(5)-glutamine methyltransferase [Pyrinomonadaceae bacterium]|jgi:release factor glutamine methyltransferase|nr:peptide chain release factor N(5)-glutamine methyltransferase [Pyrinomonadaceae bacterium]
MNLSIAEVLRETVRVLENAGVPEARREAGSLLSFILGRDRTFLISHAEDQVDDNSLDRLRGFVERRATGEPLQYITGVQDFYGREFRVTPDVLIPRPETELLVEAALQVVGNTGPAPLICDVGTGSGCIALTLLCEIVEARVVAIDKSPAALEVAKINAQVLSVVDRARFVVSDCFNSLDSYINEFDLIVSNPPYVAEAALAGLQREVRDHEPLVALSPGPDGLSVIRKLIDDAPGFIKPGGHMLMEIGFDQGEVVTRLVDGSAWSLREIRPDLQGIPRIVVLQKT